MTFITSSVAYGTEIINAKLTISKTVEAKISPLLFGQFLERPSWGGEDGPESATDNKGNLAPAIVEAVKFIRPTVLRFPGGTDVDYQDWTILIDNVPGRVGGRPPFQGYYRKQNAMLVSSRFGFDEFLKLRENLGASALIVLNLLDGLREKKPIEQAVLHATGLLAYVNAPIGRSLPEGMLDWPAIRAANGRKEPWNVEYLQIGNELWLFPEDFAPEGVSPEEQYRRVLMAYIKAIRKVDPNVKIIVDYNWTRNITKEFRDSIIREKWFSSEVKLLSLHFYCPFGPLRIPPEKANDPAILWWYRWSGSFDHLLHSNQGGIGKPPVGYRWAVTEWNWNGWEYEEEAEKRGINWQQAAAVACATFLHGLMRQGADEVELATQSMLIGQNWGIAAVKYDPANPNAPPKLSAQGQITGLFARNAGTKLLSCKLDEDSAKLFTIPEEGRPPMPLIDIVVSRSDRHIAVHLINRSFDRNAIIEVCGLYGKPKIEAIVNGKLDLTDSVRVYDNAIFLPAQTVAVAVYENQ